MTQRGHSLLSGFYNLPEQPFGESPDPHYVYESAVHSKVFASLLAGFESGDRLQILTGLPGSGKTTLLNLALGKIRDRVDSAFVFFTPGQSVDLFGFINRDLGISTAGRDLVDRRKGLLSFLFQRNGIGRRVLIIIDEAQSLDGSSLAAIDALLADAPGCLQCILSGQTEFSAAMKTEALPSMRGRIRAWHHLRPLDLEDTTKYIRHRLHVAGYSGQDLFTREAYGMIARETSGLPRNINTLCFHAMQHGAATRSTRIDENMIRYVLRRCPFARSATTSVTGATKESDPAEPLQRALPPETVRLTQVLREWLSAHSGVWSGTAWELQQRLQSAGSGNSVFAVAELENAVRLRGAVLLESGVEVELRTPPGSPRRFIVRLVEMESSRKVA